MALFEAVIKKEALAKAELGELELVLKLARATNEINLFHRLLLWATNAPEDPQFVAEGKATILLSLLLNLAGKLKEAHEILRTSYQGGRLSEAYAPNLPPEAQEALRELNKYFSSSDRITRIRNSFAFHYDKVSLSNALESVEDELKLYVENTGSASNLYQFAEAALFATVVRDLGFDDSIAAVSDLSREITRIARAFLKSADHIVTEFLRRQGADIWDGSAKQIDTANLPPIGSFSLQWFTDNAELRPDA
jgi:hypothetical protein